MQLLWVCAGKFAFPRKPEAAIVPWPPSRQGYFAPASRDAILLDGSLPATPVFSELQFGLSRSSPHVLQELTIVFSRTLVEG